MSVEITPAVQLGFHRPLTRMVTNTIKIHNPHPHPVAFKVKTTAPKQYCVRPNSGRVEPGESVEVQVLLQPLPVDPPPHAKCKDKFLVQSAFITPDEEMHTLGEMWSQTEATNKGAIQEQKIKCAYLAAEDGRAENGIREEEEEGMESRVMDESADERGFDPALFPNGGHSHWEPAQPPYMHPARRTIFAAAQSSPAPKANGDATDRSAGLPAPVETPAAPSNLATTVTPIPAAATPSASTEKPRLPDLTAESIGATGTGVSPTKSALEKSLLVATTDKEKLELALAEIERLRSQLNSSSAGDITDVTGPQVTGLRRRGGGTVSATAGQAKEGAEVMLEKAKDAVMTAGSQGVPVEVVAALVVGVFVMTYLFF